MLSLDFTIPARAVRGGGLPIPYVPPLNAHVMISGHSLTAWPMPRMLEVFMQSEGGTGLIELSQLAGSSMYTRRTSPGDTFPVQAWEEIDDGDVDKLLITEAGPIGTFVDDPVDPQGGQVNGALWVARFYLYNLGKEITLYEIWPAWDLPNLTSDTPDGVDRPAVWRQRILVDRVHWSTLHAHMDGTKPPAQLPVYLMPVGQAWGRLYDQHLITGLPTVSGGAFVSTFCSDPGVGRIHPTNKGAYFVALCWYAVLYRRNPALDDLPVAFNDQFGVPYTDMPTVELRDAMAAIAWEVMSTSALLPAQAARNPNVSHVSLYNPAIVETGAVGEVLVYATGWPAPALTYSHRLGGVEFSTAANPTLPGGSAGSVYTVQVTATNSGGSSSRTSADAVVGGAAFNVLTNSAFNGAVLGVLGSGGSLHSNSGFDAFGAPGLNIEIWGVDMSAGSLPALEVRIFGTVTGWSSVPKLDLQYYGTINIVGEQSYCGSSYVTISEGPASVSIHSYSGTGPFSGGDSATLSTINVDTLLETVVNYASAANTTTSYFMRFNNVNADGVYDFRVRVRGMMMNPGTTRGAFVLTGAPVPVLPHVFPVGSELLRNGDFAYDALWTKGTGWTIGGGVATRTVAAASNLQQNPEEPLVIGTAYTIAYTVTVTAGGITPRFTGGTATLGIARTTSGSYTEPLTPGTGNTSFALAGNAAFAGTVDNVSLKRNA